MRFMVRIDVRLPGDWTEQRLAEMRKDRSILDAKHKNRELLSQIGDLEEKLLELEETNLTALEQAKAAVSDKNTILKREDGLKTRFEHAQKKLKELEEQMAAAAAARDEAVANAATSTQQLDAVRNDSSSISPPVGDDDSSCTDDG